MRHFKLAVIGFLVGIGLAGGTHAQEPPTPPPSMLVGEGEATVAEDGYDPALRQLQFALGLFQRGNYAETVAELEKYLAMPGRPRPTDTARFFIAEAYRLAGDTEKAVAAYEALIGGVTDSQYLAPGRFYLADLLIKEGDPAVALEQLRSIDQQNISTELRENIAYTIGLAESLNGQSDQAIETWQNLLAENPDTPHRDNIILGLGMAWFVVQDYTKAQSRLLEWLQSVDDPPVHLKSSALSHLADCLEQQGEPAAAMERWLELVRISDDEVMREIAILNISRLAFDLQKWDVLPEIEPLFQTEDLKPETRFNWLTAKSGAAYHEEDYVAASEFNRSALEVLDQSQLFPVEKREAVRKQLGVQLAWCWFTLEDYDRLETLLDVLAEQGPITQDEYFLRLEMAVMNGNLAAAEEAYENLSTDYEFYYSATALVAELAYQGRIWQRSALLYQLASFLTDDSLQKQEALLYAAESAAYEQIWPQAVVLAASATALDASSALTERGLFLQGYGFYQQERFDEVFGVLDDLLTRFPDSAQTPESLYLKAAAHSQLNQSASATEAYNRLVNEFPESEWCIRALVDLASKYSQAKDREGLMDALLRLETIQGGRHLPARFRAWLAAALLEDGRYLESLTVLQSVPFDLVEEKERQRLKFLEGRTLLALERYQQALLLFDNLVVTEPPGPQLVNVHLSAGRAALCAGKIREASFHLQAIRRQLNQGGGVDPALEGRFYLLDGDVQFVEKNYQQAWKSYARIFILFDDPALTPLALYAAALCKEELEQVDEAEDHRLQLKTDYPDFRPPTQQIGNCGVGGPLL